MNFRTIFSAGILCVLLAGSSLPVRAENPLKSLGSGIKKVRNVLTPWKKSAPAVPDKPIPKAIPVATAKKPPAAKPAKTGSKTKAKRTVLPAAATAKPPGKPAPKPQPSGQAEAPESNGETADKEIMDPVEGESGIASVPQDSAESPPPAVAALPPAEIPFATPEMGRKGCVRSPFAAEEGLVDVSGIKAGTKVKCPFTQKIFRVP